MPTVALAKQFPLARVVATDMAPATLSLINAHAEEQGVSNVAAKLADAQKCKDSESGWFSIVTCSYGSTFIPEHLQALKQAYKVLQPGGLCVGKAFASCEIYQTLDG